MRLSRNLIAILAEAITIKLIQSNMIQVDDYQMFQEKVAALILDDLMVEERLDEEVRQIMEQHEDLIRNSNVEYHEMFKTIKKKLVKERKLIL